MKNASVTQGSQQPVIEGDPLPVISTSADFFNTGVSVPDAPSLTQLTIQIQAGSFFSPDPNLRAPIVGGRRNGQRGVYVGGFGGRGEAEEVIKPVRITWKPIPVYTEDAIRLKIQGEVLVDVNFKTDGKAQVVRMVQGLGHGLDESAVRAVEAILFKPATINGRAIDFQARAHVVFTLIPAET